MGAHPAMRQVYRLIETMATAPDPVLISGETGSGKELAARALHALSAAGQPFTGRRDVVHEHVAGDETLLAGLRDRISVSIGVLRLALLLKHNHRDGVPRDRPDGALLHQCRH